MGCPSSLRSVFAPRRREQALREPAMTMERSFRDFYGHDDMRRVPAIFAS